MRPAVLVKICGVRTLADALAAAEAGADLVGFNFWRGSPRRIRPREARAIARALPARVGKVGVFVNEGPRRMRACAELVGLDYLQLHGDEPEAVAAALGARCIRALRLAGPGDLARLGEAPEALLLLDGPARRRGGGGVTADWALAARAAARRRVLLAGGLTPDNVAEAIGAVRPFGVDVASGVESAPGVKDHDKVRAFVAAAKRA